MSTPIPPPGELAEQLNRLMARWGWRHISDPEWREYYRRYGAGENPPKPQHPCWPSEEQGR